MTDLYWQFTLMIEYHLNKSEEMILELKEIITIFIVPIGIALVVAFFTARLSLNSFYKREIWLRKEQQYRETLQKLCILLKDYRDSISEELYREVKVSSEAQKTIKQARYDLEVLSVSPNLIIDSSVQNILQELFLDADKLIGDEKEGNHYSYLERMYGETRDAAIKIRDIARQDLKI